jgi:hypothetical protein
LALININLTLTKICWHSYLYKGKSNLYWINDTFLQVFPFIFIHIWRWRWTCKSQLKLLFLFILYSIFYYNLLANFLNFIFLHSFRNQLVTIFCLFFIMFWCQHITRSLIFFLSKLCNWCLGGNTLWWSLYVVTLECFLQWMFLNLNHVNTNKGLHNVLHTMVEKNPRNRLLKKLFLKTLYIMVDQNICVCKVFVLFICFSMLYNWNIARLFFAPFLGNYFFDSFCFIMVANQQISYNYNYPSTNKFFKLGHLQNWNKTFVTAFKFELIEWK